MNSQEDELEVDEKQSEDGEANKSAEKQPEEEEEEEAEKAESSAQKTPPRRSTRGAAAATPQSIKVASKQPTPKGYGKIKEITVEKLDCFHQI